MKIDSPNAIGISTGFGIPTGGTNNQILLKTGSTDFVTGWVNYIPTGGTAGQYLVKTGSTNYDTAWTTTTPQYISVVKTDDQSAVGTATDITWSTVEASNGLTLASNSVALTGGKVYQITAAFSVNTFSNAAAGYSIVSLYNSSNTKLSTVSAALVTPAATNELNSPIINLIYAPSTNTTVKFRVADASGTVLYRGGGFTNFTITEIR